MPCLVGEDGELVVGGEDRPVVGVEIGADRHMVDTDQLHQTEDLVDEGLVAESTPKDDASGGPARRYYQRTRFGRAVARAESERLRALLDVARAQNMFGGAK